MASKPHKPVTTRRSQPSLVPLPATVEEGWLHDEVTPITVVALEKLHAGELHEMLTLDAPDVAALRPFYRERASAWRQRDEARTRLAEIAREFRQRFDDEIASEPLWRRLIANARPHLVRDLAEVTDAVAALATHGAGNARKRAEGYEQSTPRHDEKGTRAFTSEHYRRLLRLKEALDGWPLADLVRLILASATDWNDAPCPELAKTYRSNSDGLEALLKTRLQRARKNRATQETEAHE